MADQIPEGVAIETVWAVEGIYATDAAQRRPAVRAEHLARIGRLIESGTVIEAGAFTDMSRSMLLMRAASEAAARQVAEEDVYYRSGVWTEIVVRPFGRVVRKP